VLGFVSVIWALAESRSVVAISNRKANWGRDDSARKVSRSRFVTV
jgi:hypothetical protein